MKSTTTILKEIAKKNFLNIFFLVFTILFLSFSRLNVGGPQIIFFDIGQGDAILIQEDNFQILVDGGPGEEIVFKLAQYLPLYDKNIEIVVLTHPHDDHVRGLMNVLEEYSVGEIFINKVVYENKHYEYLLENYSEKISQVVKGDTFGYGDIQVQVLYPFEAEDEDMPNVNNESIVLLVESPNYRSLLMGDAEKEVESLLLGTEEIERVEILKVGHHCSDTSTSEMFLRSTDPDLAICSCGEGNKFGHPSYETLKKFEEQDVQYMVTYEEGDIVINFSNL